MKLEQCHWQSGAGWRPNPGGLGDRADLVLVFGSGELLAQQKHFDEVRGLYPSARIVSCSTAGEICGTQVHDDSMVLTAIAFESSEIQIASASIDDATDSITAGRELASALEPAGLVHVLVLSEGLAVNGSELVNGLYQVLPENVVATGGLSGDGDRFDQTMVGVDGPARTKTIVAIGLYGERLKVGYGSLGGWDAFGPERLVTRSEGNVLYELDGEPALSLYKSYLGEHAEGLPATGLLFPLALRAEGDQRVVRTILAVDEDAQSMVFAGDIPQGQYAQLMKANFDRLVDGAIGAARTCHEALGATVPDLALLISCVGRKLVLKQRVEEEVEGVRSVLGEGAVLTGFYSYGEIAPFTPGAKCELHNQTMTITTLSER